MIEAENLHFGARLRKSRPLRARTISTLGAPTAIVAVLSDAVVSSQDRFCGAINESVG